MSASPRMSPARRLPPLAPQSLAELVKFTAMAALLAIFFDAAVAHAIAWENDPYWTYWITDTLLMATVFGIGTAWIGVGLGRGAVLTAVHVLLLTTYYWSLSPIGLPGHGEWLDLERTWITGLPIHFGVYYLGYTTALWLWNRRPSRIAAAVDASAAGALPPMRRNVLAALVFAVGVVLVLGLVQSWVSGQFVGVTWFIVRIAITFPLLLAWWATAGTDRAAIVSGAVVIGLLLATYTHFLAPMGLPNPSLRVLAENPPGVAVTWLSWRQEFLIMLPISVALALGGLLMASGGRSAGAITATASRPRLALAGGVALLVLVALGVAAWPHTGPAASHTHIASRGAGQVVEQGATTAATLTMDVTNRNTHRTPSPPHDQVDIRATVPGADGVVYSIRATQPMVADPLGRFTTWGGVGYDVWHHGRSGIGTAALPPIHSGVAVYALGEISANGRPIAAGVPVHVMTSERAGARVQLHVGDPQLLVPGLPAGYLRVAWADYSGEHSKLPALARYAWGGALLLILLGFAFAATRRETQMA